MKTKHTQTSNSRYLNIKKTFMGIAVGLFSISAQAQTAEFDWAVSIGGTSDEIVSSSVLDASGNLYATGGFEGTVDFDPGPATSFLTSNGTFDIFVQKLDPFGNLIWAKSIGGASFDHGSCIILDAQENIYVTGGYADTVDFDPSISTTNLISNGQLDVFLQKLDSDGNLIWAKSMGGVAFDSGTSINIDAFGNVLLTGQYSGSADFDPGIGTTNLTSNGDVDVFIQKLDSSGNLLWVKSIGGTSNDRAYSISTDATGNVFVTGTFEDTVDFDPGMATFDLISNGGWDAFIEKLDVNGNFLWAKSVGGTEFQNATSLDIDALGNIYTTGSFRGTVDFDPNGATFNLTSVGASDVYIQKLDNDGNLIWAKSSGGTWSDEGNCLFLGKMGSVYVTGNFSGTVDFDPGAPTFNLTSNGVLDVFIQKLDASGNFVWAKSVGGNQSDHGSSITVDTLGNIYVAGIFLGTVDFDPGVSTFNFTSNGAHDAFILKLAPSDLSAGDEISMANASVYPNPVEEVLNIAISTEDAFKLELIDNSGKLILVRNIDQQSTSIDMSSFEAGIYFLRLSDNNGTITRKVVKD
ncbi:MAG: hypothetical protein ACI837_000630 [Crocinitomicaceae bacterium]|jgi:hypothetical protein